MLLAKLSDACAQPTYSGYLDQSLCMRSSVKVGSLKISGPLALDLASGAIARTTSLTMVSVVPRAATSSLYTESYDGDKSEGQESCFDPKS